METNKLEQQIKNKLSEGLDNLSAPEVNIVMDEKIFALIEENTQQKDNVKAKHKLSFIPLFPAIAASLLLVLSFVFILKNDYSDETQLDVVNFKKKSLSELIATSQALELKLDSSVPAENSVVLVSLNTEIQAIDSVLSRLYREGSSDKLKSLYWNKRIEKLESKKLLVSLTNQEYKRI